MAGLAGAGVAAGVFDGHASAGSSENYMIDLPEIRAAADLEPERSERIKKNL